MSFDRSFADCQTVRHYSACNRRHNVFSFRFSFYAGTETLKLSQPQNTLLNELESIDFGNTVQLAPL